MSHTVSGKLRKAPFIKDGCGQDGQSRMYAIELSEVVKDYKTQEKTYTNYSALFFAKTEGSKAYYDKAFAEGSFIVVSCDNLTIDIQTGQDGRLFPKNQMVNPRLDNCLTVEYQGAPQQQSGWGQPQQPQAQPQQRAPQQQATPQYNEPPMDFDDDQ